MSTFKNLIFPLLLSLLLNFTMAQNKAETNLNPDQLQFLLNLAGEGPDKRPSESLDRAMQAGWAKETGFQRHLFIVAAIDTIRQADGVLKTGHASRNKWKSFPRGKLALSSLKTARLVLEQTSSTEIDYMFKRFRYYEYEYLQQAYQSSNFHIKDKDSFLRAIVAGMFVYKLLPHASLHTEGSVDEWKKSHLSRVKQLVHLTFHQWLPFTEKNAIILNEMNLASDDLLVLKEEVIKRSQLSLIPLAQTVGGELAEKLLPQLPQWVAGVSQSPLSNHLILLAFKLQSLERAISLSTIAILKNDLKNRYGLSLDLPTEPLQKQFEKTFKELSKSKLTNLSKLVGKNLNFVMILRGVAVGTLIGLITELTIQVTGALINGQHKEEISFGNHKIQYRPTQAQMQMTGDAKLDSVRDRAYALEDMGYQIRKEFLSKLAGTVAWVGTYTVATPLILGAASAAGLPTAGVGGALVVAGGYIAAATAATMVSYKVSQALKPLDKAVHNSVSEAEIQAKLRVILSAVETPSNKKEIIQRTSEIMIRRQKAGHEVRFMGFVMNLNSIKLNKEQDSLVYFNIEHRSGNLMEKVIVNPANLVGMTSNLMNMTNNDSYTRKEAHIRYHFFDARGNLGSWDAWSNRVINLGLARLNHKHVSFIGSNDDHIPLDQGVIRGLKSGDDLRVLSNGVLMARNEWSRQWEIRGKAEETDIYLRIGSPGRYTWDSAKKGYIKVMTGQALVKVKALTTAHNQRQSRVSEPGSAYLTQRKSTAPNVEDHSLDNQSTASESESISMESLNLSTN